MYHKLYAFQFKFRRSCFVQAILLLSVFVFTYPALACNQSTEPTRSIGDITSAANSFLGGLSGSLRNSAMHEFEAKDRQKWSNLPPTLGFFNRPGVKFGKLTDEQLKLAKNFLSVALSQCGLQRVNGILEAENVLSRQRFARLMGYSAGNYWLAFYGEPSETQSWGWGFGGHHLAINATVDSGRVYLSPTFVGIAPAMFLDSAGELRSPIGTISQNATKLYQALDEKQKEDCHISERPKDIYSGAGNDGVIPPFEGSLVKTWTNEQREMLFNLITEWVNLMPVNFANARMAEISEIVDDIYFAWYHNPSEINNRYFRIQASSNDLLIEFSTQDVAESSESGGHYHSIYRNPSKEYGLPTLN